jgi:hypothetical protein
MADIGKKNDSGKNRVDLVTPGFVWGIGWVLTHGAVTYDDNNWKLFKDDPVGRARVRAALERHWLKLKAGEIYDDETGLPHALHIGCNAMFDHWFTCGDELPKEGCQCEKCNPEEPKGILYGKGLVFDPDQFGTLETDGGKFGGADIGCVGFEDQYDAAYQELLDTEGDSAVGYEDPIVSEEIRQDVLHALREVRPGIQFPMSSNSLNFNAKAYAPLPVELTQELIDDALAGHIPGDPEPETLTGCFEYEDGCEHCENISLREQLDQLGDRLRQLELDKAALLKGAEIRKKDTEELQAQIHRYKQERRVAAKRQRETVAELNDKLHTAYTRIDGLRDILLEEQE